MSMMHHARVFAEAWRSETQRRKTGVGDWNERDFLPAALEVTETPPSPIGRAITWTIIIAAIVAIVWACVAKVDTVAVAEGRLVPEGRLRSVEAAEQGVIRAIHVREGQHVTKGQVLIELDPTVAEAEAATARTELSTAMLTRARDNALLGYATGSGAGLAAPAGADNLAIEAERQLVASRVGEYRAKLTSISERRAGAEATVVAAQAEILKLRRTLPLLKEALDLQQGLAAQGFGARQKLLQQQQAYVAAEQDLQAQTAKLAEAKAQVAAINGEAAEAREEFVGKAAQERADAEGVVMTRGNVVREANQKRGLQKLTAPVSGTVQEITVTNVGEVSDIGKPLITIVPDGEPLVIEALLLNKDVGFVRTGMNTTIKVEAYPFTRYGVLQGVVGRVSADATLDQQRGLVFPIRIDVTNSNLFVEGRRAPISAGMSVSAEIVTGKRRVVEYLWSPVYRGLGEAGRER
ncbi:HlyD family type I secretion periplasmic adaptor subunit [Sphingomonas sp. MMS24-J13]|uniref:HlyD family type I secretion periplasmic adaptor subunit n=1 Tax=Sphingomonas sp. MMS24-J13 TaxID=3238686 RepID=UPI00384B363B